MVAILNSEFSDFRSGQVFDAIAAAQSLGRQALFGALGLTNPNPFDAAALCFFLRYEDRTGYVLRHGERVMNTVFIFDGYESQYFLGRTLMSSAVDTRRIDAARDRLVAFWRRHVRREPVRHAFHGFQDMLQSLLSMAYSEPTFQAKAQRLVFDVLRDRVLLRPDGLIRTPLALQTIAALVIAAGRPASFDTLAWERLQTVVLDAAAKPGWAGFWDIWLLHHAAQGGRFDLATVLPGQPWRLVADSLTETVPSDVPCLREDWLSDAPDYAPALFSTDGTV